MIKDSIKYKIISDHLGSPTMIVDPTGNIVKDINYDTFGNIISDSNEDFSLPFRFAGGIYDEDTNLLRFGARDYDPEVGRWTAKEPLGFDGARNFYVYALNNMIDGFLNAKPKETGKGTISDPKRDQYGELKVNEASAIKHHIVNAYRDGRSIFIGGNDEIKFLVETFNGTGYKPPNSKNQKEIVNFGIPIGFYHKRDGKYVPTTNGSIHYGQKGVHIVPSNPVNDY